MAEKKQNAQPEKNLDQVEKEKLESDIFPKVSTVSVCAPAPHPVR